MEEKLLEKERTINRLHLFYGFAILAVLGICLLLIIPGHINQKAFDNFCFAATIVSIVLAVVSIVYSFRTKNNASENLAGIREVEHSIDEKLQKFDDLEKHILDGFASYLQNEINPLSKDVSTLRDDQTGIRESIEQLKEVMLVAKETKTTSREGKDGIMDKLKTNSLLGNIALYLAYRSYETHKAIDLEKIHNRLLNRKEYLFGYLLAFLVLFPDNLSVEVKDRKTIMESEFTKFDTTLFGDGDTCRNRISSFKDKNTAKEYLEAIDKYFAEELKDENNSE